MNVSNLLLLYGTSAWPATDHTDIFVIVVLAALIVSVGLLLKGMVDDHLDRL